MENIKQQVTKILEKYTFNDDVWIGFNDKSSLITDLKINSARIVDIILDVEELYNINISDEELDKISSFINIVNLISNKIK